MQRTISRLLRALMLSTILVLALLPATRAPEAGSGVASTPVRLAAWAPTQAHWDDSPALTVEAGTRLSGQLMLPVGRSLTIDVEAATFVGIPSKCRASSVLKRESWIDDSGRRLTCQLLPSAGPTTVSFTLHVDPRSPATVHAVARSQGDSVAFADRPVTPGSAPAPSVRLISSPDFLNADLADLRHGPGFWTPRRSENGINASYIKAMDRVLDDWARRDPKAVLVAGDLVDGRWGRDQHRTGNFGPVSSVEDQRLALKRAARTYYPQWRHRFAGHGLQVFPAVGDHEYGDNPWPAPKRRIASDFKDMFGRYFTRRGNGSPRFSDRPRGPHEFTAYAWRPTPDIQVVSIDVFDITPQRARIGLDRQQRTWLRDVLGRAKKDHVRWTIVQGHTPVVGPVRSRASSGLMYPRGRHSDLWRLMRKGGVDVYLAGEVHDVTATTRDGILQLAHGGAFQFGLTTYAQLDISDDHLVVTLNDYRSRSRDAANGTRLWETERRGIKKVFELAPRAFTIGTLTLDAKGAVSDRTGMLLPWRGYGNGARPRVLVP